MTRNRWTGLAGVLFGIGFFAIAFTAPVTPDSDPAGAVERYAKYWGNGSHQTRAALTALLMTYVFLLLIAFAAALRDRLRTVDAGPLPSLVLAAGTASAVLVVAGAQVSTAIGVVAKDTSSYKPEGGLALVLESLGYQLFAAGFMAAGVMAVAVAIVTLRTRVLPVWTAWLGLLLGLAVIGSFFTAWTAFIGLPLWCLVIGVMFLLRSDDTADNAHAGAMATTAA